MPKIVMIGAGSMVFTRRLIGDILSFPELSDSTISLVDIDKKRLELISQLARKMVKDLGCGAKIESTTERRDVLDGADYVIITIAVGGLDAYLSDIHIPDKYGVNQNVGDTIGPGGVFRGLRVVPVLLEICRDMEELCPDALLINYSNPMAINCWAMNKASRIKNVGLCHSVQGTAKQLARYIDAPYEEISYWVAGINHMAWFLEFKWKGKDAYPILRKKIEENPELWDVLGEYGTTKLNDTVRFEIFKHFGYFVTESPFHMSEYVPYFRRTKKQIEELGVSKRWWLEHEKSGDRYFKEVERELLSGEKIRVNRTDEYASHIIYSMETGTPYRFNGNVENKGLITNLPQGCCVEVPCLVDRTGIHPCYVGDLPPQCAALNRTNINVQELAVKAVLEKDKEAAIHAIMLDPLTSSLLTLDEIRKMVEEMFEAEKEHLPELR
ncbi:alpha-glucosidase/alpha-galactosidase [Candidatus Aerophobetes bacterium]|nr:alpha-glucosidase/alpha-galactosidase [Candidatus Aerophobetes bacterium]